MEHGMEDMALSRASIRPSDVPSQSASLSVPGNAPKTARSFLMETEMIPLRITVTRPENVAGALPVTGGVPLAEGTVPSGANLELLDCAGRTVPLQTQVLGTWDDGSARWVLLDFLVSGPAKNQTFSLQCAGGASSTVPSDGAGDLREQPQVLTSEDALLDLGEITVDLELTDAAGRVSRAAVKTVDVETTGPIRGTVCLTGDFQLPNGERVFQFRVRVSCFRDLPMFHLQPIILLDNDHEVLCQVRDLSLVLQPRTGATAGAIGGTPGWKGPLEGPIRLFQRDDEMYEVQGSAETGEKAPGWAEIVTEKGTCALALRDFWQQWPKAVQIAPEGMRLGLLPAFETGDFSHMEPWYKHQWFFNGNCYQLRNGQARSWDLFLSRGHSGLELASLAATPPVPVPDPAQAIATGVWGEVQPAGIDEMAEYDPWAERLFESYVTSIEAQRDYGAMNWGDWFGERRINWGNHEYDTTNQLLIQYARTGNPVYLRWADAAGRHSAEVDTVHHVNPDLAAYFDNWHHPTYPSRPGLVHEHAHGHVGGFMSEREVQELLREKGIGKHAKGMPYSCLDPFNLGHVWTTGMMRLYFLTGNPFLKETVETIGDNLARLVEDREYTFMGSTHCGRVTGWPLLALGGAFEISRDQRYVEAMRTLAEDALDMQDPVCGGWIVHPMAHDHCICKHARHTGMATFITAVLINGLARYYELSGDERMVHCIDEAVTYVNNDTWRENLRGWRYTSCPGHRTANQGGVIIMAYVNAVTITRNPEHLRILRLAWEEKFGNLLRNPPPPGPGQGKSYTSSIYGCPEAAGLLAG